MQVPPVKSSPRSLCCVVPLFPGFSILYDGPEVLYHRLFSSPSRFRVKLSYPWPWLHPGNVHPQFNDSSTKFIPLEICVPSFSASSQLITFGQQLSGTFPRLGIGSVTMKSFFPVNFFFGRFYYPLPGSTSLVY